MIAVSEIALANVRESVWVSYEISPKLFFWGWK